MVATGSARPSRDARVVSAIRRKAAQLRRPRRSGHDPPPVQRNCRRSRRVAAAAASARNTVTIIDGSTGKRQEVADRRRRRTAARRSSSGCSKARGTARSRSIAPDGARPAEAYARAATAAGKPKGGPRIAIVIDGLGVSANVTRSGDRASCPGR